MLQKQPININFSSGVETKTDPFQLAPGKFLSLQNSIFDIGGQLTKRNGYGLLSNVVVASPSSWTLTSSPSTYLTTYNSNLTAIGTKLQAYLTSTESWVDKGSLLPVNLTSLAMIRNSTNQSQADSVTALNGSTCVVYTDQNPASLSAPIYKYAILDSETGQNIVAPTTIDADATYGTPRVFLLGNYFVILYTTHPASYHLTYIAIGVNNPTVVTAPADITTSYIPSSTLNFDGLVVGTRLYIGYNTTAGGQSVKVAYITSSLGTPATPIVFSGSISTMFSLTADMTNDSNPIIYVSFYDAVGHTGYVAAINQNLNEVLPATQFLATGSIQNLTSTAQDGIVTLFYEYVNAYTYDGSIRTDYISKNTMTQAGVLGTAAVLVRSVGLASKAFLLESRSYFLAIYNSTYQPTYFLINDQGNVVAKLAYSNAKASYYTTGLPNVTLVDSTAQIAYFYKDLITSVNKDQGSANTAGIYSQTGINLATFEIGISNVLSSEIGQNLNITGGYVTAYDGSAPVEQGFFLWPDYVEATPSASGGSMADQQYYYQVTYEWADNQGNVFRSAPSIPVSATVSGGAGSGSVTLHIPTLRLTYKTATPVKIVVYRWSAAQQNYFQVTTITSPLLNSTAADSVDYVDTSSDSSIAGNALIYTTGGVVENISPPATSNMCLFNNRLFLVDAEDRNLLWFSKQVIESTPVEMSDLLTLYVAPTTASQGSTGPITAIAPMDDKLIIFKQNALGYISGIGPDNTGSNNQYSDVNLINSVVGCTAQQSIVFTPQGLMFQSNKGIWLLGRDLSTSYIGSPVEAFTTDAVVQSAVNIPMTNQVRFTLSTGITLMYDYFYGQWGTFTNVPAVSATIFQNLHTFVNSLGQVLQETPGSYLDNTSPVLMSFTTGWLNLAGLQGYERFYYMLLLGQYLSPFTLSVQLAYNYNPSTLQSITVTPDNQSNVYGGGTLWGGDQTWGGTKAVGIEAAGNVFEARVFPKIQKCESFQLTVSEQFDPYVGQAAGAGLTLSGMNLMVGMKRGARTNRASRSFG